MAGMHRKNEVTRNIIHRVYRIGDELRQAVSERRRALGLTVRAFLAEAIEGELPSLVEALRAHLPLSEDGARPARLPLTEALLDALRKASQDVGVPAARLLMTCLARAAARKRRRPGNARMPGKIASKRRRKSTAGPAQEHAEGEPGHVRDADDQGENEAGSQPPAEEQQVQDRNAGLMAEQVPVVQAA